MATREYLESLLRRVRERVPKSLYDELHAAALPSAGGRASWRDPKVTPLEKLGLDSLTAAGVRRADDDTLRACWQQLGAWHKQAGRKKQDQGPFARVAGYVMQEMQGRGLEAGGALAEAAMAKSTMAARLEDLPDVVPLALGAAYLERVDGGISFDAPDYAEAALSAALASVGLDDGSEHKAACAPAVAPLDATPLYDLALVRSAPQEAPDGAGMWEIVEKAGLQPLEKGEGPGDDVGHAAGGICPIICAQAEEQVIWYRIAVPGEKDTYGHEITKDEIRKAAHGALQGPMGVKLNHQKDISGDAVWVESYILPAEIPNGATYHGKAIEDGPYVEGEWHGAIHYKRREMWEKRRDSDEGISWAGMARKVRR